MNRELPLQEHAPSNPVFAPQPDHQTRETRALAMLQAGAPDTQLQALLADMANVNPPADLGRIYKRLQSAAHPDWLPRLIRLAPMWQILTTREMPEFTTRQLSGCATLFSSLAEGPRGALICFTDLAHQMFIPNARLLMLLGEHPLDIVLLRPRVAGAFGTMRIGQGTNLYTSLAALCAELAALGIKPKAALGASVGGLYALRATALLGLECGISLSGRFFRPGGPIPMDRVGPAFDPFCGCFPRAKGELHALYGAQEQYDPRHAARLQIMQPQVHLYPVDGSSEHNPLITLTTRLQLRTLMLKVADAAMGKPISLTSMMQK